MFYLSQLLSMPIEDSNGQRLGKISDLLVQPANFGQSDPTIHRGSAAYPSALLVEGQADQDWRVPTDMLQWQGNVLQLRVPVEQLVGQTAPAEGEVLSLAHDILDKQVIDIVRKKAVRVNDVCLDDDWQILGIDNSTLGLVRRLAPSWLLGTNIRRAPTNLIPWDRIELIGTQQPEEEEGSLQEVAGGTVQTRWGTLSHMTRTPSGHLAELHPADIADIVHQLTPEQGARLLEGLDDETAADALEEVDTESQTHILENISTDRAADILQAMGPDEAADLLAKLSEERAQELLALMNPEESEDVQDLLKYEEDTAGGLMTTDYIALDATRTVADALDAVRTNIQEHDVRTAYVYCVADASQDDLLLQGVVSLWDLLVAPPIQPLQELMETDIISVRPETDPHAVAEIMAKYNLLAVPVVNEQGILEGIVTVDDALDILLPAGRRRKPTRMY